MADQPVSGFSNQLLASAKREAGCLHGVTGNDVRIFMLTCMRIEFGLTFDVGLRHAACVTFCSGRSSPRLRL